MLMMPIHEPVSRAQTQLFPTNPSLWQQLEQAQSELQKTQSYKAQSLRELSQRESEQSKLVAQIEQLKAQPAGPVRDLRLNELLAQAKDRADDLSQRSSSLQKQSQQLVTQQQRLLQLTDRLLSGESGSLDSGKRLLLLRQRATLSEQLYADEPERLRALALSSATLGQKTAMLDEPQALRDRADLLRDSADKLLREMKRLKERRETLMTRQRVRQRAQSVDEDLFAEQATSRRGSSAFGGRNEKQADSAAAPTAGGGTGAGPVMAPTDPGPPSGALRTAVDPATLDALLRSESSGDAAAQVGALSRAEAELQSLASQLQRRAAQLEQQASGLGSRK
jgi:hypothetical protein